MIAEKQEIKNAVITHVFLGFEDHGIFTMILTLDYGSCCQGFGHMALSGYDRVHKKTIGAAIGTEFIMRVLRIAGVEAVHQLSGRPVRACCTWNRIHAIGHLLKEEWLSPEELSREFAAKEAQLVRNHFLFRGRWDGLGRRARPRKNLQDTSLE